MSHGKVCWNELNTNDVEKAKKFYAETIGWTFDSMPDPEGTTPYWLAKNGDEMVAGIFDISGPNFDGIADAWMTYVGVDSVDKRLEKAVSAGATVLREPWDIPGVGRMVVLQEPGGAVVSWMTPEQTG